MIGTSKNIWGFDPRSVPGCQLWLDGADSNTVTGTTSVTAWRDKSGNGNNAVFTGTNPSYTPANKYVETSNLNQEFSVPGTIFNSVGGSLFIVYADKQQNTENGMLYAISSGYTPHLFDQCLFRADGYSYALGGIDGPGNTFKTTLNTKNTVLYSINYVHNSVNYTVTVNGTVFPFTSSGVVVPSGSLVFSGGWGGAANIKFNEILFFNSIITTSQRQQIEGYLAHKWGLTTYSLVTPLSIPGCSLWLDGADPAGTGVSPANGTTLTTWKDKSVSNFPFTSMGSVYNTTAVNGLPGITLSTHFFGYDPGSAQNNWQEVFAVGLWTGGSTFNAYNGFVTSSVDSDGGSGGGIIFIGNVGTTSWYTVGNTYTTPVVNGTQTYTAIPTIQTPFVIRTFSASAVNLHGLRFGVDRNWGGRNWVGFISEVICYNTALTTTQRQSIEGYLARKWRITSMYSALPSIHPFSSIRPHLRTFQPSDIPGCQLWLDAADASSLVLSGSSVTQWNDKSGNGYHMNTIAGTPPNNWSGTPAYPTIGTSINGLQTVNFKAQSGLKQATTLDGVKNLFWVGRIAAPDGSGSTNFIYLLGHDSAYDWTGEPYGGRFISGGFAQSGIYNASASLFTNDPNAVTNATFINVIMPSAPNVSLLSVAGITGTTRYQGICYDRETHIGWCGDLAEVLIFNSALTTSQRQQVEGYLAQKWGLTPYLPVISPLSIPGCSLWLDGADPAGTGVQPSNGATVSTWVDKATAKNATATGTPTYVTGGGVNFNGSSYFLNQNFIMNLSQRSIFIVMQETSRTIYSGVFLLIPTPNSSNDHATNTSISVETTNGLYFANESYASRLGNSTLLVKAIYNDNMSGTTGSGYFNGTNATNVTAGAVAGTCSGYGVGGRWLSGSMSDSLRLNGVIYEIIVFNTPLNTIQRQSIEGYLARKWGISISATLPSPHPFKSILPATAAHFYPTDITGCSLWLDGADSSQVTFSSSSNVNTWIDKSGFNNSSSNQSLGTTITYPGTKVNGLNTVNFTAGCIRGAFNGSSVINTTDVTIFIVTAETAPNDNLRMFSLTPAANYQDDQASNMLIYCAPGNYQLTFFRGGAMPSPYTVTQNVPFIYSLTQTSGTGSMWLNGGSNRTASITTSAFAVTNYNIGTQYLANQNYTGLMCEVVVYNTLLNTSQQL
jgi:hypothetical protein